MTRNGPAVAPGNAPRMARQRIFRQEALDYHYRDPESRGVIATRLRWTPGAIAVVLVLLAATATYVFLARAVVHALFERLLR